MPNPRILLTFLMICPWVSLFAEDMPRLSNKELLSDDFVDHTRGVIRSVVERARTSKAQGDARTAELVAAGVERWDTIPPKYRARVLILGLGVAMDTTTQLRESAVTERFWKRYETDDERRKRLKYLGAPTIHGRRDLCEHFFVSAALTALTTPQMAEAMGILKEVADSNGGTGFSFKDLAADISGIIYAKRLLSVSEPPAIFLKEFRVDAFVPVVTDLNEGIMIEELRDEFRVDSETRFRAEVEVIRMRILALPVHGGGDGVTIDHSTPQE